MEYWYDQHHTGTLRVLDTKKQVITGSDPQERFWTVQFEQIDPHTIAVDFSTKKTHRGRKRLVAKYKNRRNSLVWDDGNEWLRIRHL